MSLIGMAGGVAASALVSWFKGNLGKAVVGGVGDVITDIVKDFNANKFSAEERDARIQEVLAKSAANVAKTDGEMVVRTFATAMGTFAKVPMMAKVWAVVTLSTLLVILAHALAIPTIVFVTGREWPPSGDVLAMCVTILLFNMGAGAYAVRGGQGQALGFLERIKKVLPR